MKENKLIKEQTEPIHVPCQSSGGARDDLYFKRLQKQCAEHLSADDRKQIMENSEQVLRLQLVDFFAANGWEGDGEINCIFIPSCFYNSDGDTMCATVFHVKQSNNGTSWLALPKNLRMQLPEGFTQSC